MKTNLEKLPLNTSDKYAYAKYIGVAMYKDEYCTYTHLYKFYIGVDGWYRIPYSDRALFAVKVTHDESIQKEIRQNKEKKGGQQAKRYRRYARMNGIVGIELPF